MNELWKDIPSWEGVYMVSNLGRVKSLKFGKERILKERLTHFDYTIYALQGDGLRKEYKVHRLVGMAFLGLDENNKETVIGHKDNNTRNNIVDNLYITTQKENQNYKKLCGRSSIGSKHGRSKLTDIQVLEIYKLRKMGMSLRKIENLFNYSGVFSIVSGKNWKHLYHNFVADV